MIIRKERHERLMNGLIAAVSDLKYLADFLSIYFY